MCVETVLARRCGDARLLDSLEFGCDTAGSPPSRFHAQMRFFVVAAHDVISRRDARSRAGRRALDNDGRRCGRLRLLVLLRGAQRVLAGAGACV